MTSTQRARKRKRYMADVIASMQAEQQGKAIAAKTKNTPVTPRLRKYYYVDGMQFNTGQKRRQGGGLRWTQDSNRRPIAKPVQKRHGKQTDLKSKAVHERIEKAMRG